MAIVSIIIATFNSRRTLPKVLEAINRQTYPKKKLEIMVVDGGSTDSTVSIAKQFHCRVIHNPNVEPLYAKYLGYRYAKGSYIIFIDHDEVFENADSIKNRVHVFESNKDIKAVIGTGYKNPKGLHIINQYINEFGDPFSFFIYRLSKNTEFFLNTMRKRYKVILDIDTCTIFDLSTSSMPALIELVALGGMIDAAFFKKKHPEIIKQYHLMGHLLYILRTTSSLIAITKNDGLFHYASDNLDNYVKKIIWRIKNNIFYTETLGASGFSGREQYQTPLFVFKKFMFLPYAFSLVLPCLDGIYLSVTRKKFAYMIHVPLTILTALCIVYYFLLKLIRIKPVLKSYDGSRNAFEMNQE